MLLNILKRANFAKPLRMQRMRFYINVTVSVETLANESLSKEHPEEGGGGVTSGTGQLARPALIFLQVGPAQTEPLAALVVHFSPTAAASPSSSDARRRRTSETSAEASSLPAEMGPTLGTPHGQ